ncbi:hypothetical protein MHU86_16201 [Fragilaria crotonensis]|nr:hypothetical protein MHU86_16201 [Fragilaria crotonensis]
MSAPQAPVHEESSALRSIIGGPTKQFFEEIWQKACVLYSNKVEVGVSNIDDPCAAQAPFQLERVQASPYHELLRNNFSSLVQLLEKSRRRYSEDESETTALVDNDFPLLFQDREIVSPDPYNHSLFHAYLNGCSVVVNHADETCPYLAALCLDLQKSLPHAYANTYLTPPDSQAVPPHADDRDVLILQVYGKKQWKVYKTIPIPYPYPHEQVGKDGLEVPPQVLEGPCLIDCVLEAGDVLYMPRGYVHQAQTVSNMPSYHVTIALATHDWTLAGLVTTATQHTLHRIIPYRQALPVHLGRMGTNNKEDAMALQVHLDAMFVELKARITAETVIRNLTHRHDLHNNRSSPIRLAIMTDASRECTATTTTAVAKSVVVVVGREAATLVQMSTRLTAATPEEKASLVVPGSHPRGLHVREAIADTVMEILARLKSAEGITCRVRDLRELVHPSKLSTMVCDLTLLSFAKSCVELGAIAIVPES